MPASLRHKWKPSQARIGDEVLPFEHFEVPLPSILGMCAACNRSSAPAVNLRQLVIRVLPIISSMLAGTQLVSQSIVRYGSMNIS